MSLIQSIEGFFGKQLNSFKKIFTKIEPVVEKVLPIVKEIGEVALKVAGQDHSVILAEIGTYLGTAVSDATAVDSFIAANQTTAVGVLYRDAAAFVLANTHGALNSTASDINLAIETAVALNKS